MAAAAPVPGSVRSGPSYGAIPLHSAPLAHDIPLISRGQRLRLPGWLDPSRNRRQSNLSRAKTLAFIHRTALILCYVAS